MAGTVDDDADEELDEEGDDAGLELAFRGRDACCGIG
jgi:hypothetical protein